MTEIERIALDLHLSIKFDKARLFERVNKDISASPILDPLAILGLRRLTPPEIERILICVTNLVRQNPRTKEKSSLEKDKDSEHRDLEPIPYDTFLKSFERVIKLNSPTDCKMMTSSNITKPPPNLTKCEGVIYKNCIMSHGLSDIKLSSVGGLSRCKRIIHEVVRLPLTTPDLFSKGILSKSMTGLLIFGPPGTGKTLVCKAIAEELQVNFLNIQPSVINSMWHGESEKNISAVFSLARKIAPCVILVDEFDAILSSRRSNAQNFTNVAINQFMQEWDGMGYSRQMRR